MQQDEQPERMVSWRAPLAARLSIQVIAGLVLGAGAGYLGTFFGGWLVKPEPGGFGDIGYSTLTPSNQAWYRGRIHATLLLLVTSRGASTPMLLR